MRLERVVPAVAIIILLSGLPSVASDTGDRLAIVAPSEGDVIGPRATITLAYNTTRPFAMVSGYLTLDGAWAGSFSAPVFPGGRFTATLNATGFASGAHALGAVAFTNDTAPVEAAPVSIVLDHPPVVTADASYDLDARTLRVSVTVDDEGPQAPFVNLSEKNASVAASFVGTQELALPIVHGPGAYNASLVARDARGQNTSLRIAYEVVDRPATLALLEATYLVGGRLALRVEGEDADGGIREVSVDTKLGNGSLVLRNGTWVGDVSIAPQLGTHNGTLVAWDKYGSQTRLAFTFTIGGPQEIVFERVIETTAGAHANVDVSVYVPRILNGTIEICLDVCGDRAIWVWPRSAVVVAAMEARDPDGARQTCIAADQGAQCHFETRHPGGWPLDLAWTQAGDLTVTVRVTGVRV